MRKIMMIFAAISMQLGTISPAGSAPTSTSISQSGNCAVFASDYDGAEKSLAVIEAEGLADNSAPRATMREIQASNQFMRASIDLTLMQARDCSLPDHAPTVRRYLSSALDCSLDKMKGVKDSPKCDRATWVAK